MSELYMEEIQEKIQAGSYTVAAELFMQLIQKQIKENDIKIEETYYEYGMFLFNLNEYESALIMFKKAYQLGFHATEIKNLVYSCFIEPNRDEFVINFENSMLIKKEQIYLEHIPSVENLSLDFIPIAEQKYMIFNKQENKFEEIIDLSDSALKQTKEYNYEDEFSDLVVVDDGLLKEIWVHLEWASDRTIYCISKNVDQMLSFLKLQEITEKYLSRVYIFDSLNELRLFLHSNSSVYLPRIFITADKKIKNELFDIIELIHFERIGQTVKKSNNILLSICIPTFNRGHRVLHCVKELLKLPYDSEIEIVVSNNGSTEYRKEYKELERIKDNRIIYFEFKESQGFTKNLYHVITMAKGNYSVIMSDEDLILPLALPYYFRLLSNAEGMAFGSSATMDVYKYEDEISIFQKGDNVFETAFYHSNISGLIYNNAFFHNNKMIEQLINDEKNEAIIYYPHICWNLILGLSGDYFQIGRTLLMEGKAERTLAVEKDGSLPKKKDKSPYYSSIESRLTQQDGFIQIINKMDFKRCQDKALVYYNLCKRTFFLLHVLYHNSTELKDSILVAEEKVYLHCLKRIEQLGIPPLFEEAMKQLVKDLKEEYKMKYLK